MPEPREAGEAELPAGSARTRGAASARTSRKYTIDGDATPWSTRSTGPRFSKRMSTVPFVTASGFVVAILVWRTTGPPGVCTVRAVDAYPADRDRRGRDLGDVAMPGLRRRERSVDPVDVGTCPCRGPRSIRRSCRARPAWPVVRTGEIDRIERARLAPRRDPGEGGRVHQQAGRLRSHERAPDRPRRRPARRGLTTRCGETPRRPDRACRPCVDLQAPRPRLTRSAASSRSFR